MTDTTLVLLLQIVKNNGSIEYLTKIGYQYSQIANFINWIIDEDYANYQSDLIVITKKGEDKLIELNKKLKNRGINAWISSQDYNRVESIKTTDVFLPKKISE